MSPLVFSENLKTHDAQLDVRKTKWAKSIAASKAAASSKYFGHIYNNITVVVFFAASYVALSLHQ